MDRAVFDKRELVSEIIFFFYFELRGFGDKIETVYSVLQGTEKNY
jgi:hypothetical protein